MAEDRLRHLMLPCTRGEKKSSGNTPCYGHLARITKITNATSEEKRSGRNLPRSAKYAFRHELTPKRHTRGSVADAPCFLWRVVAKLRWGGGGLAQIEAFSLWERGSHGISCFGTGKDSSVCLCLF